MDTGYYLFAGYAALWLIPTVFLLLLTRRLLSVDARLKALELKIEKINNSATSCRVRS